MAGQLTIMKNTPGITRLFQTTVDPKKQLTSVYQNYFDELVFPEMLHQNWCVNWLLIWAQVRA